MRIKLLSFLFAYCFIGIVQAQEDPITKPNYKGLSDARFTFRPMIFIDYNLYHWYQEPRRQVDATPKNLGQAFNVLPGIGGGFVMGKKTTLLFTAEASVRYMPFSLDVAGFEGMGSVAFPVIAGVRIPLNGILFLKVGGGVQWTNINIHQRTPAHQKYDNPFFMTYLGELGLGIEENIFLMYFLRFGYHPNQATTFDVGLKLGLNGNLWD